MEPGSSPAWTDAGVGGCPGEAVSEPFLLVVAGAANSGRSTFLGALFGEQVARRVLGPGPAGSGDGASRPAKGEPPGFARARSEPEAIAVALDRWATPDGEGENSRLSAAPGFR